MQEKFEKNQKKERQDSYNKKIEDQKHKGKL